MAVIVQSKTRYQGTVTPSSLNTETTVIEVKGATDDYIMEGYLDLSALQAGDTVVVNEYIAVDGANYGLFVSNTYSGPVQDPVIRFHTKTLLYSMLYKVTVTQTSGTPRSLPYGFLMELLGTA